MDEFEKLLAEVSSGVERFVRYRLPLQADADDVLQEIYLSAYRNFTDLKNKDAFKNTPPKSFRDVTLEARKLQVFLLESFPTV